MELKNLVKILNSKYQFVKNNKYWNYNNIYNLSINGSNFYIQENDFLLKISQNIVQNTNNNFIIKKSIDKFEIPNLDIDLMKEIVKKFFVSVDLELSTKVDFILNQTQFIQYDDNKSSIMQRSVSNANGICFYYKNNLKSLVDLAHEVSHGIANLDSNCKISNSNKVSALSEAESELTEELFLNYLKEICLLIKDNNQIREITDDDIDDIKYNKYKWALSICNRAIDELRFKKMVNERNINDIDDNLINELSISMNIGKNKVIAYLDRFIEKYYPGTNEINKYLGKKDYDLKDGRHLSNECRFIYAFCLVEKFNSMSLNLKQKYEFYKKYLENAKNMTFQEVLELFEVNLSDTYRFSEEFVIKYNELASKSVSLTSHV